MIVDLEYEEARTLYDHDLAFDHCDGDSASGDVRDFGHDVISI